MIPEAFLIEAAKPVINSLVNNIITPKIKVFAEKIHVAYNELLIPRGEHFEEYLYRTYKKYSIINTLVFKNEQRLLKDLYIPLTLLKEEQQRTKEQFRIEEYPIELIRLYQKILITDTAGMGKSTLTKLLFLNVIENGYGIPIYIEMRRLKKDRPILHEIQEQINSLSKEFDVKLLLEFIQTGGFIFFLDGYDEISVDERSFVTSNIQDFISKAGNNIFIMTSRPEQTLACFGDFQRFTINPLTKKEAFELLRKYDKQGTTSKQLIEVLRSGQYEMINEFLKNPLLVSLLYAAFDYKQTIPLKKHIFYRQVYDAYFDSHDLSKGDSYIHDKLSQLDTDDFDRVLRYVGFKCIKYQKIEFEKDTLLHIIDEARTFCSDLSFNSSDFLNDLLSAVPLFCQDGQYYRWVHKSLQEYFAAQFIFKDSKQKQDDLLTAIFNSDNIDKYVNLLDLYYDIDNWGFTKNIKYPLFKAYVDFYDKSIYESEIIRNDYIEERIGQLFGRKAIAIWKPKVEKGNPFSSVSKMIKERFEMSVETITMFDDNGLFIANTSTNFRKLFPLLKRRQFSYFKNLKDFAYPKHIGLKENSFSEIVVTSGCEDQNMFELYNFMLNNTHTRYTGYLDYEKCKDEINRISGIINKNDNSMDLIDGI